MNRLPTALLSALEAVIAAVVGLAALLVPLSLLWAVQFELHVGFEGFWRAASVAWLLGHGVDVGIRLDDVTAVALGLDPSAAGFPVTIALLGLGAVSVLFARRIGVRAARAGHPVVGAASAALVFGVVGWVLAITGTSAATAPNLVQAFAVPAAVAAGAGLVGAVGEALRADAVAGGRPGRIGARVAGLPPRLVDGVRSAFRSGIAAAALLVGVAALLVALLVFGHYAEMVGLYEALQSGVVGGIALTVAQLALLPNLVVWTASWLLTPGFALGAGTAISPTHHLAGPVPGLPIAAIVPSGTGAGLLAVLVPVAIGAVVGWLAGRRDGREPGSATGPALLHALERSAGGALVAAAVLGLLAWWSGGAVGPGRLSQLGPDPLAVAVAALAAVGVPLVLGSLAAVLAGARFPSSEGLPASFAVPSTASSAVPGLPSGDGMPAPAVAGHVATSAETPGGGPPAPSRLPAATSQLPPPATPAAWAETEPLEAWGAQTEPLEPWAGADPAASSSRPEPVGPDAAARRASPLPAARPAAPRASWLRRRPPAPPSTARARPTRSTSGPAQPTEPITGPLPAPREAPPLRVGLTDPKAETRPVPLPPPSPDELPWWRRPPEPRDDD